MKINMMKASLPFRDDQMKIASMQFSLVPATRWPVYEEAGSKKRR